MLFLISIVVGIEERSILAVSFMIVDTCKGILSCSVPRLKVRICLTRLRAATGLQHFREVSGQAGLRCRIQQAHLGESDDGRQVTAVPQAPAHLKGVINLRGQVIPVSDLRLRFGMDTIAYNDRTCIILVDIRGADSTTRMGVIVDTALRFFSTSTGFSTRKTSR